MIKTPVQRHQTVNRVVRQPDTTVHALRQYRGTQDSLPDPKGGKRQFNGSTRIY